MRIPMLTVLAAGLLVALPAAAQFQKPEDAIAYRKSAMTLMSAHLGRIGAMVNGKVPFDAKAAAGNAEVILAISKLPYVAFVDGSDKGETRAKPEVWTERPKFEQTAATLQDNVVKLDAAAKTGNLDQLKATFGPVAQTCKSCHDYFRKE